MKRTAELQGAFLRKNETGRTWGRREFLGKTCGCLLAGSTLGAGVSAVSGQNKHRRLRMKFAPHFGMFGHLAGEDLVDQLKFAADQGFSAWEDNGMKFRALNLQKEIARTMENLRMEMGVISALKGVWKDVNFAGEDQEKRMVVLKALEETVDVARRVNTRFLTVVPGLLHPKLPMDYQISNCVDLLKRCCDIVEPHGLTLVIEPLNHHANHPGVFLHLSPQAYLICRSVNRPSCKILFDIYHQQVSEGNLLSNIERCWDQIGYFQVGDNPGRNEPGTGEINYQNVLRYLLDKGYSGPVGMEHGNSQPGPEGERMVVEAYRELSRALDER